MILSLFYRNEDLVARATTTQVTQLEYNLANIDNVTRDVEHMVTVSARNSIGLSNESTPVIYTRPSESSQCSTCI